MGKWGTFVTPSIHLTRHPKTHSAVIQDWTRDSIGVRPVEISSAITMSLCLCQIILGKFKGIAQH